MVDGILDAINEISKHTGVIADSVVSVSENSGKMNELTDKGEAEAESIYEIINQFKDTIAELNQDIAELKERYPRIEIRYDLTAGRPMGGRFAVLQGCRSAVGLCG